MKKLFLALCLMAFSYIAISFESQKNEYPSYLSEELITTFENEYLETIEDSSLNKLLEKNFPPLFDEVKYVHAQRNQNNEFYYIVFAIKNGNETIDLLKINELDVINKTYSYIDFSEINLNDTVYCRAGNGSTDPFVCPEACENYTFVCLGMICGVYEGGQCIQQ